MNSHYIGFALVSVVKLWSNPFWCERCSHMCITLLCQLSKSHGPVMTVYVSSRRCVVLVLCGYEALKEALVDRAEDFSHGAPIAFLYKGLTGYGKINNNCWHWAWSHWIKLGLVGLSSAANNGLWVNLKWATPWPVGSRCNPVMSGRSCLHYFLLLFPPHI